MPLGGVNTRAKLINAVLHSRGLPEDQVIVDNKKLNTMRESLKAQGQNRRRRLRQGKILLSVCRNWA